jgi:hypothetical protein
VELDQINELHYITPLVNLPSILELGILSNKRVKSVPHSSVADEAVQDRREDVQVPGGLRLHEYVNLYFNARNAMMYKRQGFHAELGVVSINRACMNIEGVVVADRNASVGPARFGSPAEIVPKLDSDLIFSEWWIQHDDYFDRLNHKQAMCAEVLVPRALPPSFIRGVYVSCAATLAICEAQGLGCKFRVNEYLFFRGPM